jgi:hypothetical protein
MSPLKPSITSDFNRPLSDGGTQHIHLKVYPFQNPNEKGALENRFFYFKLHTPPRTEKNA